MCGIVGVMSKRKTGLFSYDMDAFTDMLFADQVRGAHGTGIFYDIDGKAKTFKGAMPSSAFLRAEKTPAILEEVMKKSNFVIGHNRHATKGEINFANTHPFIVEDITLIHNGTLHHHKNMKDVDVDSHAICHSIADVGHLETLKKLDGAFALVWYDSKEERLHFIRNTERPLHLIETDNLFIISSEAGLAEWIIKRRGIKGASEPKMCEVGQLYTYDIHTNKLTEETVDIRPKYQAFGGKYYPDVDYYYGQSYTPPHQPPVKRHHDTKWDYVDVRVQDEVIFSPIDVSPHNKTNLLTGIADALVYDGKTDTLPAKSMLQVKYYHPHYDSLNALLEHATCIGTVMQIIFKGNTKTCVIRNVRPMPPTPPLLEDKKEETVTHH